MSAKQSESAAELDVQNIGGIDETSVVFEPGVTVLADRNATNRTSFLQAVIAAVGSNNISVKADAEKSHVELALDGETYVRTLERRNGTVATSGEPYLEKYSTYLVVALLPKDAQAFSDEYAYITEV